MELEANNVVPVHLVPEVNEPQESKRNHARAEPESAFLECVGEVGDS